MVAGAFCRVNVCPRTKDQGRERLFVRSLAKLHCVREASNFSFFWLRALKAFVKFFLFMGGSKPAGSLVPGHDAIVLTLVSLCPGSAFRIAACSIPALLAWCKCATTELVGLGRTIKSGRPNMERGVHDECYFAELAEEVLPVLGERRTSPWFIQEIPASLASARSPGRPDDPLGTTTAKVTSVSISIRAAGMSLPTRSAPPGLPTTSRLLTRPWPFTVPKPRAPRQPLPH
jgi:hypothetical protein